MRARPARVLARGAGNGSQRACSALMTGASGSLHVVPSSMLVAFDSALQGFYRWSNKRCFAMMCCGMVLLLMLHQSHSAFRIADASFDTYPGRARFYPLAITTTTRLHSPSCLLDHNQPCSPAVIFPIRNPILLPRADTGYNWQLVHDAAAPLFSFFFCVVARGWRMDLVEAALCCCICMSLGIGWSCARHLANSYWFTLCKRLKLRR